MTDNTYITILFLFITLFLTHLITKRIEGKGCITFGYISLVVLSINLFTIFSWFLMFQSLGNMYSAFTSGQKYTAEVVDYTSEEQYDSEEGTYTTMYTPIVQFTTDNGKLIEKSLDHSSSDIEIGEEFKINYNQETGKVITLGFTMVIFFVITFIFWSIFTLFFVGMLLFISGNDMKRYKAFVSKFGFYFFLPFLMIGFDALLIYGTFYGNEVPTFVTYILYFFIFVLTLGILAYIKNMIDKGEPKLTRVSTTRWVGHWEEKQN